MIPEKLKVDGIRFVLIERGTKKPFQIGWQNKNIAFNDVELNEHIKKGGNYGVMGGGEKNLLIVDFDNAKIQEELLQKLPKTFTVKTGSGMLHKYYFSDKGESFKIFDEDMNTLIDVQGEGKQAICSGSIHPNGNKYELIENEDIAFINYSELQALIIPYDKKPKKEKPIQTNIPSEYSSDNLLDEVKRKISMQELLNKIGVDTSKNPTNCPFHDSKGGKCLGFNEETAHCFHCEGSWNIFSLIKDYKRCGFKEALEWLCETFGLQENLKKSREAYKKKLSEQNSVGLNQIKEQVQKMIYAKAEDAASETVACYIKDHNFIFTTRDDLKSEIWYYDDGIYIPNGETKIKEICRMIFDYYYTPYRASKVIAKIKADTGIDSDKFFVNNHLEEIPVLNGILNIFTRELKEFTPSKIFFSKCPVKYDPSKSCPNIDKFLSEVLQNPEDKTVYYEIGGFCLLKEYRFEKAFMLVGNGRNGKGKSLELIKRVIGAQNCFSLPLVALQVDNADVHQLFGKLVNLAGDIGYGDLKDTSMFKSLTGRDLITTKRKFLTALTFENYAKFVFACNELPKVYDTSKGFWDRWVLLEYPYYFADKEEYDRTPEKDRLNWKIRDENIISRIATEDELSGLFNKFLEGLSTLVKKGKFSSTKGSEQVKDMWIRKSDSFQAFCMDMLEMDPESMITKKSIRNAYSIYCKRYKLKGCSDKSIKITLENDYGVVEGRKFVMDVLERTWEGIRWKEQVK